jgi:hypothetical protein
VVLQGGDLSLASTGSARERQLIWRSGLRSETEEATEVYRHVYDEVPIR